MLNKSFAEEQGAVVDERLARAVRIIIEQYDGDVKAFVQSIRYKQEVNRKAAPVTECIDRTAFRQI